MSELSTAASQTAGGLDAGVGQVREVEGHHLERHPPNDVVVSDPEQLALAELADDQPLAFLITSRREVVPEVGDQRIAIATIGLSTEPVEETGVADHQLAEVLARAEELNEDLGRPRVGGEQFERGVGIGAG